MNPDDYRYAQINVPTPDRPLSSLSSMLEELHRIAKHTVERLDDALQTRDRVEAEISHLRSDLGVAQRAIAAWEEEPERAERIDRTGPSVERQVVTA